MLATAIQTQTTTLKGLNLEIQTISQSNMSAFLEQIKIVNKLPFNKCDYYFTDSIWDFSPYSMVNVRKSLLKFNFDNVCECFREELKFYVLFKILENSSKIQTINQSYNYLYNFLNEAHNQHFYKIEDITGNFIKSYLTNFDDKTLKYLQQTQTAIKSFYKYYSVFHKDIITSDIKNAFKKISVQELKTEAKHHRIPNIPNEYYNNVVLACLKIMEDESVDEVIRATAAFYLILSQTGLRIGECLTLEANQMESIPIFNGETAYYLKYKSWKNSKGNSFSWNKIYVTELTKKGYDFLTDFYSELRGKKQSSYLFMGTERITKLPMDIAMFDTLKKRLFIEFNQYFPTVDLPDNTYENINNVQVCKKDKNKKYKNIQTVAMPTNHQFRVFVCTDLYNKGVPLKYIEKFMNHLSAEMADYYIRPTPQNPQEDKEYAKKILGKMVKKEIRPLGGNQGLIDKINKFIEENHYNVETDLNTICEKLAEDIPVRQKTGGVCIKSAALRECKHDSKTNEFYCAYGVCRNIFHFFYMADVSYRQAKELSETIEINRNRGLVKWVEKETNMLHNIVKTKLIPELDELKNVINKKGVQAVMMEYPDLKDIVENLEEIYKEAEQWLTLKSLNTN